MRIMGLDIGERTIGVAVSDLLGWTAQGVTTIRRKSLAYDLEELKKIIKEYEVEQIVVGWPLNMNGTAGPSAERVTLLSAEIVKETGLEIIKWDERLSTVDVSRAKRKEVIDKMAAVFILQGYLDGHPQK